MVGLAEWCLRNLVKRSIRGSMVRVLDKFVKILLNWIELNNFIYIRSTDTSGFKRSNFITTKCMLQILYNINNTKNYYILQKLL